MESGLSTASKPLRNPWMSRVVRRTAICTGTGSPASSVAPNVFVEIRSPTSRILTTSSVGSIDVLGSAVEPLQEKTAHRRFVAAMLPSRFTTTQTPHLASHCRSRTRVDYLGCAFDGSSTRTLQGVSTSEVGMTIEACAAFAQKGNSGAGYRYFGVEFGSECNGGNTLMPSGEILTETSNPPSSSCNMKCSGEESQICGGAALLSLYHNSNYTVNSAVRPSIGSYRAAGCLTDFQSGQGLRSLAATSTYSDDTTGGSCVEYLPNEGLPLRRVSVSIHLSQL